MAPVGNEVLSECIVDSEHSPVRDPKPSLSPCAESIDHSFVLFRLQSETAPLERPPMEISYIQQMQLRRLEQTLNFGAAAGAASSEAQHSAQPTLSQLSLGVSVFYSFLHHPSKGLLQSCAGYGRHLAFFTYKPKC